MRKCSMCGQYVKLSDWPTYNGKYYTYCRDCKRVTQRLWQRQRAEIKKADRASK